MRFTNKVTVTYHNRTVGTLSMTPDNRLCAFQYDKDWSVNGFSISPLDLPLKSDLFIAKPEPFWGNFGIFEDSLPDGYGRYLLNRMLKKHYRSWTISNRWHWTYYLKGLIKMKISYILIAAIQEDVALSACITMQRGHG